MPGRFLRGGGRTDRSGQERFALALLPGRPFLLRASSLLTGFGSLAFPACGVPLLGAFEQRILRFACSPLRQNGAYRGDSSDAGYLSVPGRTPNTPPALRPLACSAVRDSPLDQTG